MSGRGPNCFVGLHVVYSNTLRTSSSSSSTWSSWSSSSSLGSAGSAGQTKCVFNANMQQQQQQQLPLKLVDSWVDWEWGPEEAGEAIACAYKTLNRNFNNLLCTLLVLPLAALLLLQLFSEPASDERSNNRKTTFNLQHYNNWFIKKISMRRLWQRGEPKKEVHAVGGRIMEGSGAMGDRMQVTACQTTCHRQQKAKSKKPWQRRSQPIRRFHIYATMHFN